MTAATQGAEAPKSAVVAAMLAKTTPAPAPAPTEHELEIAHLRAALAEAEAARQETRRLFDEAVTQRAEAWRRFEAASGRNLDGVSLADRATFDREWTAHMARKAITDATATA